MNSKVHKTVTAAMFAALVCVATMIIKIPSPFKGYLNLGDCVVLLCGWILSPAYAFLAAGVGSALADMFLGYAVYMPVTFIIKGIMALIACKSAKGVKRIFGGVVAEIFMVLGYFIFEGFLYGFKPSVINIPANAVQGAAGLVLGIILVRLFEKNKIMR